MKTTKRRYACDWFLCSMEFDNEAALKRHKDYSHECPHNATKDQEEWEETLFGNNEPQDGYE